MAGSCLDVVHLGEVTPSEPVQHPTLCSLAGTAIVHIAGITDARNGPSIRLLERVGFRLSHQRSSLFRGEQCTELVFVFPAE